MNTYVEELKSRGESFEQREGPIARAIEKRTAKIPSDVYLWAAGISVLASLALEAIGIMRGETRSAFGRRSFGRRMRGATAHTPLAGFVGMWVPSLLLLGVYNKIVKVAGSDRTSRI